MAKVVLVKFVQSHRPYNAGEIAGFPPHKAKELVDNNAAVYVDAPAKPEPKNEEAAPAAMKRVPLDRKADEDDDDSEDSEDSDDDSEESEDSEGDSEDEDELEPKYIRGKWYLENTRTNEVTGPFKRSYLVKNGYKPKK